MGAPLGAPTRWRGGGRHVRSSQRALRGLPPLPAIGASQLWSRDLQSVAASQPTCCACAGSSGRPELEVKFDAAGALRPWSPIPRLSASFRSDPPGHGPGAPKPATRLLPRAGAYGWLPAGQETEGNIVLHRPDLSCSVQWDGAELRGVVRRGGPITSALVTPLLQAHSQNTLVGLLEAVLWPLPALLGLPLHPRRGRELWRGRHPNVGTVAA